MRFLQSYLWAALAAFVTLPPIPRTGAFRILVNLPTDRQYMTKNIVRSGRQHSARRDFESGLGELSHEARRSRTTSLTQRMAFDTNSTPPALDAFHAWLTKSGVKLGENAVMTGRSPLAGERGLITTKAVQNGQTVLTVPQSLGLTVDSLKSSGIARYVSGYEGWTGDTGVIALQLLWEKAQGDKSRIAPWIAVMPGVGELNMPMFWGEEDLALADGSSTRVRSGTAHDSTYIQFDHEAFMVLSFRLRHSCFT